MGEATDVERGMRMRRFVKLVAENGVIAELLLMNSIRYLLMLINI